MKTRARRDDGQTLLLALAVLILFGAAIGLLLAAIRTNLTMTKVDADQSRLMYAADGGVESAVQQVRNQYGGVCPSAPLPQTVSMKGVNTTVNVTCKAISGPGSNTFGGYSVITGVNALTNGGTPNQGNPACISLSADALGSGSATQLQTKAPASASCPIYKATGTGGSLWVEQEAPGTANLNAVYAFDPFDIWAVGDKDGGETIWFSEGDEWDSIAAAGGGNTSGVKDKNLFGVYAADLNHVFAVGQAGTILACTGVAPDGCTVGTATWALQSGPTVDLNAVHGIDATHVWAVGKATGGPSGKETIWYYNGSSWVDTTTLLNTGGIKNKNLTGVWAASVNDVWAVGDTGTIFHCSSACTSNAAVWAVQASTVTANLTAIDGLDASNIWVSGAHGTGNKETILFYDGATWTGQTAPLNNDDLAGITVPDASDVFAVGLDGANAMAYYSNPAWATLVPPTGSGKLSAVTATPANAGAGIALSAWAVGDGGQILFYSPAPVGDSLAQIEGGPVFNANGTNFVTSANVANGNFTQYAKPPSGACAAQPAKLTISAPYSYTPCATSIPASITALPTTYHLPDTSNGTPFACVRLGNCTPQNSNGFTTLTCGTGKVAIFAPGYYTTKPKFDQAGVTTYFFESGIYYFNTGNWGGIGKDNAPVWIIGGQPSAGDTPEIATNAPCWSTLAASGFFTSPVTTSPPAGSWQTGGTGVEWILGGTTWLDVHTVNLEVFTRLAPTTAEATIEGAQGISIREVSPSPPAGWTVSNPGGTLQMVQVDANNHNPNFYLHGGLFVPNNNVEFFTNLKQVTTGPIFANSLELGFAKTSSPPLKINPGGNLQFGVYQFLATATTDGSNGLSATSLSVEAVVTFDRKTAGVPVVVNSWRVKTS